MEKPKVKLGEVIDIAAAAIAGSYLNNIPYQPIYMEGTTGRQRIPAQVFENIMLPVPPKNEIKNIENSLSSTETLHSVALSKLVTINTAKKSYMQKLFGVM